MQAELELLVARSAGFCTGVRRAVDRTEELLAAADSPVVTLGPLMHSAQEVQRLTAAGAPPVDEGQVQPGQQVVLRTHGVPPEQAPRLRRQGAEVTDCTCPYVRSCQTIAARMSARGYAVLLVGDPGHAEVQAVVAHARQQAGRGAQRAGRPVPVLVLRGVEELDQLELEQVRRVAVLAQTTEDPQRLGQVVAAASQRFVEVRAFNTICEATLSRQQEARQLAAAVDLMLVVGGNHSANTRRLAQVCRELNPRTHQLETAAQLQPGWLGGELKRVGITAGASTPGWLVQQVVARVRELGGRG